MTRHLAPYCSRRVMASAGSDAVPLGGRLVQSRSMRARTHSHGPACAITTALARRPARWDDARPQRLGRRREPVPKRLVLDAPLHPTVRQRRAEPDGPGKG